MEVIRKAQAYTILMGTFPDDPEPNLMEDIKINLKGMGILTRNYM
jgi:hypothetical protein